MHWWKSLSEMSLSPIEFFFLGFSVGQEIADTTIKSRLCSKTRANSNDINAYRPKMCD